MRSHGLIYRPDGTLKAAWSWQDRTRACQFFLPVEDGDEVVMLDSEHPDIPDEVDHALLRQRQAAMKPEWAHARTVLRVSLPSDPNKEAVIQPGLMRVLTKERAQNDSGFLHEPQAGLIREEE